MQSRNVRRASVFLLSLLLADTLLTACAGGGTSIRRPEEDAWLLSIAGYYQLMGELPPPPAREAAKAAQIARITFQPPEPKTPNEAYSLMEYYMARRADVEKEARAQGLPAETVAKALGEYDAKIEAYSEKGANLAERRARHRGTAWKRFFDGLGRFIGGAFDLGGKVVKFAVEGVPTFIGEYTPAVVKALAQEYVKKLRGELRTKVEQKAFEILVEKSPNLAGAYLIFKAGRGAFKVLRDFARLFGRHGRRTAPQQPGGGFGLPPSGLMMASCNTEWYHRWAVDPARTILDESFVLEVDYDARSFDVAFYGQDRTVGEQHTQTLTDELSGTGTVSADGFLMGAGSWDRTFNISPPMEGSPATSSVSIPISWVGIIRDGLQRVDIEFCRGDEAVPSLQSLQSQGRAAFPAGFACQYIFACTEE